MVTLSVSSGLLKKRISPLGVNHCYTVEGEVSGSVVVEVVMFVSSLVVVSVTMGGFSTYFLKLLDSL